MSSSDFPANLLETSILVRGGPPDFSGLESAGFPTPAAGQEGAILEHTDTGNRWRWTGTKWIQIVLEGSTRVAPTDYFVEVASGNVPGTVDVTQEARNHTIGNAVFETLWDQGGSYTYLTADTQLFASSSSTSDTATMLRVCGLDANFAQVIRTVTLNGQTQVALSGLLFRVREAFVINASSLIGDVYIAESDTLTLGVPDTISKIKTKIPLEAFDSGDYASTNMSHNGFFTVPAGFDVFLLNLVPSTPKNDDIRLDIRKREDGESWISLFNNWSYSGPGPISILNRSRIQEKADIEFRVLSGNPVGEFSAQIQFLLRAR